MRVSIAVILLSASMLTSATAQSQFAGKWQTRTSAIRINIVESEQEIRGTVVLVNPDRREIELPITKPKAKGTLLEFETVLNSNTSYWSLTVNKDASRGLLHVKSWMMQFEGPVFKQH